jgi:hypothetical protein
MRTRPLAGKPTVLDIEASTAGLGEVQLVAGVGDQAHRQKQLPMSA